MSDLSDPKCFGPGGWDAMHINATRGLLKRFDEDTRYYATKIHCLDCRKHFASLLDEDPPLKRKKEINKEGNDVTAFRWSVDAHNKVNKRLGKKEYPYEQAYAFYYHDEGCQSGCGEQELPPHVKNLLETYKVEGKYLGEF
jgi:hypothetical protein